MHPGSIAESNSNSPAAAPTQIAISLDKKPVASAHTLASSHQAPVGGSTRAAANSTSSPEIMPDFSALERYQAAGAFGFSSLFIYI